MKTVRFSYALSIAALLCYPADAILVATGLSSGRAFPTDWILPILSLVTLIFIPVTWAVFGLARNQGEKVSVWPQVGLIPFWLHSIFIGLWLLAWVATGGL